ncbi:MAG: hypothetical protein JWR20_2211 [Marmoricola sp.]|nr:hypothetical protein [Marmoricola sp.]
MRSGASGSSEPDGSVNGPADGPVDEAVDEAQRRGRQAEQSDWLDHAVRFGLVAYGVVHLMLGWLALQLALGGRNENASTKGALRALARQPAGTALVWAIAAGMALLVVWRLLEAAFGHRREEGGTRVRKRLVSLGKGAVYAALGVSAAKVAAHAGSGSSKGTLAQVLGWPGGPVLVVLAGLAVVAYAGNTAWRGWKEKFAEHLDTEGKLGTSGAAYLTFGKVGYIGKGISLAIVGGLLVLAGVRQAPAEGGGLDQGLQKLLQQPFGQVLIALIGLGLICYGLFCFARARYLDR